MIAKRRVLEGRSILYFASAGLLLLAFVALHGAKAGQAPAAAAKPVATGKDSALIDDGLLGCYRR